MPYRSIGAVCGVFLAGEAYGYCGEQFFASDDAVVFNALRNICVGAIADCGRSRVLRPAPASLFLLRQEK
jgi:hypothetical protein